MFKNKHVITALIVTPILAVTAYFAMDYVVSERPHQAEDGGHYQLVQLPNCRYASGQCVLKNGNFKVVITGEADIDGALRLNLESVFPLDAAHVSVVSDPSETVAPELMELSSDDGTEWHVDLSSSNPVEQYLRVAVSADGGIYYAETQMPFLNYETSFHKDFRKK